jgi:hypothetical protein
VSTPPRACPQIADFQGAGLGSGAYRGEEMLCLHPGDADRYLIGEGQVVIGADLGTALGVIAWLERNADVGADVRPSRHFGRNPAARRPSMDLDRSANEGPGSRRSGYSDRRGIGLNAFAERSVGRMLVLAGEASSPVPLLQSVRTFA